MNITKKILLGIMLALVFVLCIGVSACSLLEGTTPSTTTTAASTTTDNALTVNGTPDSSTPSTTAPSMPDSSTAAITTAAPPVTEAPYETVTVSSSEMYTGSLIVVNSQYPYSYRAAMLYTPSELDRLSHNELSELGWTSLYANRNNLYLLRTRMIFVRTEAYTAFHQMMSDYVAKSGNRDVQVRYGYQLMNGASDIASLSDERATGLVIEINVYTSEGAFSIDHVTKRSAYYEWFAAYAHKYGFIMTGESGFFRYVGVPHAYYISKNHMTLDQYISHLASYSFDDPLSFQDDTGVLWNVYTVPAASGQETEIPVEKDAVYTVSGNNKTGFVVTSRADIGGK